MQRWEELEIEKDEARKEGRNVMAQLVRKLLESNRIDDCKKAVKDPKYCKLLLKEFGLETFDK